MVHEINQPPLLALHDGARSNCHSTTAYNRWTHAMSASDIQPSLPTGQEKRALSPVSFDFVMEDPTNPQNYREKRVRSRTELDKQKEDIRQLKEYGGACQWCYRNKKKCGPSTPCPPCLSNRRECVRRAPIIPQIQADQETNLHTDILNPESTSTASVQPSIIDDVLDSLQPSPWEFMASIDGTCCEVEFNCGFIRD